MSGEVITLAHGNGGRHMRELIEGVIAEALQNPSLELQADAATVDLDSAQLVITTDGFTVQPLEFPGGSIGTLAVHGTLNDLAVAGATPLYLSLNVIVEEGFALDSFQRLMTDIGESAQAANVAIVTGDTKVVPRGQAGGMYLVTTGIGRPMRPSVQRPLGMNRIEAGDVILVSGPIGDHGTAVLLAREEFGLSGPLQSDCANVVPLVERIVHHPNLKFLRDPTRGGLATVANEVVRGTGLDVILHEADVPIRPEVESVCDMLGFDPYFLACEGRVVAITASNSADMVLNHWKSLDQGQGAACVGELCKANAAQSLVRLKTRLGGERVLDELEDDPLPRIC